MWHRRSLVAEAKRPQHEAKDPVSSSWVGVSGQRHAPAALPLPPAGERPGIHCISGWVGPRAGVDGCGKSRPIGIRSPDRPARSESLCRLSYPGPHKMMWYAFIIVFRVIRDITDRPRAQYIFISFLEVEFNK